jgi:hypothetical protein
MNIVVSVAAAMMAHQEQGIILPHRHRNRIHLKKRRFCAKFYPNLKENFRV